MVRIYNFQLSSTDVELRVNRNQLSLSIFDSEETSGENFEKSLGHAIKRLYKEFFEEQEKESFRRLFKDAYIKHYHAAKPEKGSASFEMLFAEHFAEIFDINYKEVFKKEFVPKFKTLFDADFEAVFSADFEEGFGMNLESFLQAKFFQIDNNSGLYVKKAIDPRYQVYSKGREAFETYYNGLANRTEEPNYRQKLMRTYQIKMNETEVERFRNDLNLNWIAAEEAQITFERGHREYSSYLEAVGIERGETIPLEGMHRPVLVAIIDTGIDFSHPQLRPFLKEVEVDGITGIGYDAFNSNAILEEEEEIPQISHGTGVAGVVEQIFSSTNQDHNTLKMLYIRAFPDGSDSTLANAIYFAAEQGATVINCSWGPLYYRPENVFLQDAIRGAKQEGAICVFAAGNQGNPVRGYFPANSEDVITVGAIKKSKKYSEFSNYGPALDITASGEQVLSYAPGNKLKLYRGTSFAAPIVSATIALYISKNDTDDINEIRSSFTENTDIDENTEVLKVDYESPEPMSRERLNVKKFLLP